MLAPAPCARTDPHPPLSPFLNHLLMPVSFLSLQGKYFWRQPRTSLPWRRRWRGAGRRVRCWRAQDSSTQPGVQGWMPATPAGWLMAASAIPSSPRGSAAEEPCRVSKPSSSIATRRDSPTHRADTMRTASEVTRGAAAPKFSAGLRGARSRDRIEIPTCSPRRPVAVECGVFCISAVEHADSGQGCFA